MTHNDIETGANNMNINIMKRIVKPRWKTTNINKTNDDFSGLLTEHTKIPSPRFLCRPPALCSTCWL